MSPTYRRSNFGKLERPGHSSHDRGYRQVSEIRDSQEPLYFKVWTNVNVNRMCFLVDTGADISLVKVSSIPNNAVRRENVGITLTGITGKAIEPEGFCSTKLCFENPNILEHKFIVVPINFQINHEADGIIGRDFLYKHKAVIDYDNKRIRFKINSKETNIKFVTKAEITDQKGKNYNNSIKQNVSILNHTIKYDSRFVEIMKEIEKGKNKKEIDVLTTEENKIVGDIVKNYEDIFFLEGDKLTCSTAAKHSLPLKEEITSHIFIRQYRLPEAQKKEINTQTEKMLEDGIIKNSNSPWNFPLLVVPKKEDAQGNKKWRVVIDFRKLNEATKGDAFPIPNISDILDHTGKYKYFTSIDLASGYHQIPMDPADRAKTAFSTPTGHYEFVRMPFGLKGAPATFQRAMNNVLAGLQGNQCLVYLDDIIIFGKTIKEHYENMALVFERLRQYNLKVQPQKCQFLRKEIKFLGHVISEAGIKPDPEKITAVSTYPTPTNLKEIQSFLGFANYYRRFIKHFAKLASPMNDLLKKDIPFMWSDQCKEAFELLKSKLTSHPILIHPDFEKEFLLTVDASGKAIGAVLSQGEVGKDLPISFASRALLPAEQRYSTIERELLAIVWGTQTFRPYLWGRHFQILSDHQPLIWGLKVKDPSSRLLRFRIKLEEYSFTVNYKPGKVNTNADALSRIPYPQTIQVVTRSQKTKQIEKNVKNKENKEPKQNEITFEKKIITNESEKQIILKEYHINPLGGHQGVARTLNRIKLKFFWKGMLKDVAEFITRCASCQINKSGKNTKVPMEVTTTSRVPFEKMFLDIVGPLPVSNEHNKYILTMQDDLTKFSEAIPIPDAEATTIAKVLVTQIICRHGTPRQILTDQGTNFLSAVFKGICKLLNIDKLQTTAYHPQSNGALERSHKTLAEYIRHYTTNDHSDWDIWLPYAMFIYNTTPHCSTGFTPFKILYGYEAELPSSIKNTPNPLYNYDDYVQELRARLQSTYKVARDNLIKKKQDSKETYDKGTKQLKLEVGDLVLLKISATRKKLTPLYHGPYEVIEINSNTNTTIKIKNQLRKVHNNNLKLFNN